VDRPSDLRELDEGDLASHALFLRRLAKRLVRDKASADDVAQETWRAALARPPRETVTWRAWLTTAARNVARQMARSGARRAKQEPAGAAREGLPSTDEVAARLEAERRLIDAVAVLPDDDRALILLRHFDGLPPRAIARRMQAPVETVKTRLKRALERLRERLVERGGDPRRLYSGLLLVANGLVGKVGAAGGVLAGGVAMSLKGKVAAAAAALVLAAVAIRVAVDSRGARAPSSAPAVRVENPETASTAGVDEAARDRVPDVVSSSDATAAASTTDAIAFEPDPDGTAVVGRFVGKDGAPLEGVEVSTLGYGRDGPPRIAHPGMPTTRSGADGRFTWAKPSPRSANGAGDAWGSSCGNDGWADALVVRLVAWRPGVVVRDFQLTGALGRVMDAGDLVLEREARIAGRVVIPSGIDPAAVTVLLESTNDGAARPTLASLRDFVRRVHVDAGGHFEFVGLGRCLVRAWAFAPGIPRVPSPLVELRAGEAREDLFLTLVPRESSGPPLSIDVEDPDGAPLPEAHVSIALREWGRRVETYLDFVADADGHIEIETYGDKVVAAWAWSKDPRWLPAERLFPDGDERACVLRLSELLKLEIDVRSSDGSPLNVLRANAREVEERFHSGFGWSLDSRIVDGGAPEARRLELQVPDAPVLIEVTADGCADQKLGPLRARSLSGPLAVTMEARPALTGRVTSAGLPVAGASIAVLRAWDDGHLSVVNGVLSRAYVCNSTVSRTDGEGRFRIVDHDGGPLCVRAHAPGFASGTIGPFESTRDTARSDLDIELTHGGSLTGQVVAGADGSRAPFVVISNGDGVPRSWPVSADGTFSIDHLVAGAWNVRTSEMAISMGYTVLEIVQESRGDLPTNCVIREGETTTLVLSSDDTLACILRGKVVGRDGGSAMWGAWVGAGDVPIPTVWNGSTKPSPVLIGREGEFECRDDVPGRAQLVVFARYPEPEHASYSVFSRPLELTQGIARMTVTLDLGGIEGDVGQRVEGRPLAVEADATTADGFRFHAKVRLLDDGRFTLPIAPAGEVRLHVGELGLERTVTVATGATTNVTLR